MKKLHNLNFVSHFLVPRKFRISCRALSAKLFAVCGAKFPIFRREISPLAELSVAEPSVQAKMEVGGRFLKVSAVM